MSLILLTGSNYLFSTVHCAPTIQDSLPVVVKHNAQVLIFTRWCYYNRCIAVQQTYSMLLSQELVLPVDSGCGLLAASLTESHIVFICFGWGFFSPLHHFAVCPFIFSQLPVIYHQNVPCLSDDSIVYFYGISLSAMLRQPVCALEESQTLIRNGIALIKFH